MRLKSVLTVIMVLMLMGVFLRASTYPSFEKTDCKFKVPAGVQIQCGYVSVPEKRGQMGSPNIRLHVAVIQALDSHPEADPVVVLNGGPGSYTLAGMDYWMYVFSRILSHRTLILFDPRGVGYSLPSLDCPEAKKQWQEDWTKNLSVQVSGQDYAQALRACHDRLTAAGVDLSAYTTAANAADVKDVRRALGYSRWNLYGGDYGARLALAVMQADPGGVRSVILDSAYVPQVNLDGSRADNLERSLRLVFERCVANKSCNRSFSDLNSKFQDLVHTLDSQPQVYRIYTPATDSFHDLVLNGDRWIWAVSQMFYGTSMVKELPKRVGTIGKDMTFSFGGDLNQIVSMNANLSEGVYYSIQCREESGLYPTIHAKQSDTSLLKGPPVLLDPSRMSLDCAAWGENGSASVPQKPVSSDIPTLILTGELDPITPPEWGRLAGKTLIRSQFLEFPGFGHGVLGGGPDSGNCTFQIVTDFIDKPNVKVDSSCIHSLDMGFLNP